MEKILTGITTALQLKKTQVETVLNLLAEGATIPFIARYRKDATGNLDEVHIQNIQQLHQQLKALEDRKAFVIKTIQEQGKLTDALAQKINDATTLATVEDIYLPYKPKRKTKAQTAKENGLEPLAQLIMSQHSTVDVETEAGNYLSENVKDIATALQGARDIIAELVNEDAQIRAKLRKLFEQEGCLIAKVIEDKQQDAQKYKDYFDYKELISKAPSHRILAVLRGFLEGVLRMSITPDEEQAIQIIEKEIITSYENTSVSQIKKAIKDAWRRLLQPSLESEFRTLLKQKADEEAIQVFADNLKQLLLSAPLGNKKLMAIDPGYRTGCKVVCLDETGALLHNDLIYIHEGKSQYEAEATIKHLVAQYQIEVIAVGDGTAGRETEQFIKKLQLNIPVYLVNEDGASVYSASETAREEFPDYDVTVRGAVSIGRRLMDPLAELVKIDPKSIGVGQYQHDVNQFRLKEKLDATVVSCVNKVGVNLNTASKHLLSYVSGLGPSLAENIVKYRTEQGKFTNRKQLLKVPRLGEKAFEQCAGFLRIHQGEHPLDKSAVHPEAYPVVEAMAKDLNVGVKDLIGNEKLTQQIDPKKYVTEQIGLLTIQDIIKELIKPGLDPRENIEQFEFASIYSIEEVQVGAILPGIVTNLTKFGAFVDIGVKQDGLVHISEIDHQYISDPAEVLKLNDKVQVKVLEVDVQRKRIALSIKQTQEAPTKTKKTFTHKTSDLSQLSVNDALNVLKKKFGK